jgi:hypothetical protein
MAIKLQISQSIRVVHAAIITHLDSFEKITTAFEYDFWKDNVGIHHFFPRLREDGYDGSRNESNLGSVRLRPLGAKLTEIVMEESRWLQRGPNLIREPWDVDDDLFNEEERRASFDRILSVHREIREYIIQALQEDRLITLEGTNVGLLPKPSTQIGTQSRVFISYAHEDLPSALKLYEQLKGVDGINPWFDKESLLPGMRWRPAIKKAIREADFFIALLSRNSVRKRGYVQTEMKEAFEIWDQFPEDKAFLIPVRLEECEASYEKLREVQRQDFFPNWDRGLQKVLKVISTTARTETPPDTVIPIGYEYRCAIVDFDNGLTNLAQICQRLNLTQNFFHFSFPSFPRENTALRDFDGTANLYVPDVPKLYKQRAPLNADVVVCLTRYLLAFEEDGATFYNYLSLPSDVDDTFKFVTTHGLYEAAKKANCTFEKSMVYQILTQLLIHFASDLGFHNEIRGCLLDFCEEHSWIIKGMKKMHLCRNCEKAVENIELKTAVLAILADPLIV